MKLSLVGAAGKMGKALTSEVQQNKEFEITNYVVKPNSFLVGYQMTKRKTLLLYQKKCLYLLRQILQ
jgi:dihydrodipicolinate reductase